jgi:hypothetical protein
LHGVPKKIGAAASIPAANRKKRPRANAARARIAGLDLIDAPRLNRVRQGTTASDEGVVMHIPSRWRDQAKVAAGPRTARSGLRVFTEGFDTIDLKETKALLNDLAA